MYRLDAFKLSDMAVCGTEMRQIGLHAGGLDDAAEAVVRYLYDHFTTVDGEHAFSLVRLFKTQLFDQLDSDLKRQAISIAPDARHSNQRFLCLMAAAGQDPKWDSECDWNDPRQARARRIIPVAADELRSRSTIAQWLLQVGNSGKPSLMEADEQPLSQYLVEPEERSFNVFYVPDASKCPFIAEQDDFVKRSGIKSVLGYGSMLNRGSFFAVVLFSRVFISRETAQMFNPLALSTKYALMHGSDFNPLVARAQLA